MISTKSRHRLFQDSQAFVQRLTTMKNAIAHRGRRLMDDEAGQTPTEYLMIVGLMAAVVVLVFITFYWDTVRDAASEWTAKVRDAIRGEGIQ